MEYIKKELCTHTVGKILCCECGDSIEPNPVNLCGACIKTSYDIAQDISKSEFISFCPKCERFLEPPAKWISAVLESKELLRICLKKIKLHGIILEDSHFLWTEPHSRRLMMQVTVKKEIAAGYSAQQITEIEFVIQKLMCNDCHRVEAKDFWNAKVQIRQKADHKRTFYYLEQLILKYHAVDKVSDIKATPGGVDFFFVNEQHANRLTDFVASSIPCTVSKSKKLKSHDIHSGIYNYKNTTLVDIVPICKDNIVCLPPKVANQVGQINQICIILKVENNIFLLDPATAQVGDISSHAYWREPFYNICNRKCLREFIIIEIEKQAVKQTKSNGKARFKGKISSKHSVVEVWAQRSSEVGTGELIFARTHLGHILKEGDLVLGFDLKNANPNDENFDKLKQDVIPDLIIVKKIPLIRRSRKRNFRLKHIGINEDNTSENNDYMDFLDDLEEDEGLRNQFAIPEDIKETEPGANDVCNSEVTGCNSKLDEELEYKLSISKEENVDVENLKTAPIPVVDLENNSTVTVPDNLI